MPLSPQLETLWRDLRYALRMLLKNPVFTLITVAYQSGWSPLWG